MIQTKWVLSCWMWLCMCCGSVIAQPLDLTQLDEAPKTIELPILIPTVQEPVVHVPDGGKFVFGGGVIYQPAINVEIVPVATIENGSRVYRFAVDGKPWQISINDDDSIDITMVKEFTIADMDQLRKLHPDIAARVENFPDNSMRGTQINWRLEITSSVSVMHEGQLKALFPGLHEVFTQYIEPVDNQ